MKPAFVVAREPPLAPLGVLARGEARPRLLARLLGLSDVALARLVGVGSAEVLVVLGAELP